MNSHPSRWLLFFCLLKLVTSSFVPHPTITPKQKPNSTSDESHWIYISERNLTLNCALQSPIDNVELSMEYEVVEWNPVYPSVSPNFMLTDSGDSIILEIWYVPDIFVAKINVSCHARDRTSLEIHNSTHIQIEQLYDTKYAKIQSLSNIDVNPGDNVALQCLADGNPKPDYYWNKGGITMPQDSSLHIKVPENEYFQEQYSCGANQAVQQTVISVTSSVVTVTSTYVAPPEITPIFPVPSFKEQNKIIFAEASQIKLECLLPHPKQEMIELKMEVKVDTSNPVFSEEKPKYLESQVNGVAQMEIYYNSLKFIPLINVTCKAINRTNGDIKQSSTIQIEQKYKTKNVVIQGASNVELKPGMKLTMTCIADGNPSPDFQFYNKTAEGDVALGNGNAPLVLSVPKHIGVYFCSANNSEDSPVNSKTAPVIAAPIIKSISETYEHLNFVYLEESRVKLNCSLPHPTAHGIVLKMESKIKVVTPNLLFPQAVPALTEAKIIDKQSIEFDIIYEKNKFIPLIEVSCHAVNGTTTITQSTVQIEQKFKTTNVKINEKGKVVTAGSTVTLTCLADGNPEPEYQWHNSSKTVDDNSKLQNANNSTLQFVAPYKVYSESYCICEANNTYNPTNHSGISSPVKVTSVYYVPSITFNPTLKPIERTEKKVIYSEESKVELSCKFPGPPLPNIHLEIDYEQLEDNPIYSSERVKFVSKDEKETISAVIEYNNDKLVPLIQVTCKSKGTTESEDKTTSVILIEQHYKTKTVIIQESDKVNVQPQEDVKLSCIADGNPLPTFQWYNLTNNKMELISNTSVLQFTVPPLLTSQQRYQCAAWNKYNNYSVNSTITQVTIAINRIDQNKAVHYQSTWFLFTTLVTIVLAKTLEFN